MEDLQSEYDFLTFSQDDYIKTNVTKDESIQYSDKIIKINRYGFKQDRNIIITDKGIYNLNKTSLRKRRDIKLIRGITLSNLSDEFVIHCNDEGNDYHYISTKRKKIIEIIAKYYYNIKNEELKLFALNQSSLKDFVTSKEEKMTQKNFSKMPKINLITVNEYIYGKKVSKKVQKKEAHVRKKNKIITNAKVELQDFEIIK